VSKSEGFSPHFGVMDGVKDHAKSGFVENLQEGRKGLPGLQCAYEKADADLKRTSEMVGTAGRFSLSANVLGMRGAS
jgi:hypothetical protein